MAFLLRWTRRADEDFRKLRQAAQRSGQTRQGQAKNKTFRQEGLLGQITKTLLLLSENPRHPGLQTHAYESLPHPYHPEQKVFDAYAQNQTPGAYRVFWCYGPGKGEITIIAITPHP